MRLYFPNKTNTVELVVEIPDIKNNKYRTAKIGKAHGDGTIQLRCVVPYCRNKQEVDSLKCFDHNYQH